MIFASFSQLLPAAWRVLSYRAKSLGRPQDSSLPTLWHPKKGKHIENVYSQSCVMHTGMEWWIWGSHVAHTPALFMHATHDFAWSERLLCIWYCINISQLLAFRISPPQWFNTYGTQLLTWRSQHQISPAAAIFQWRRYARGQCTVQCQCVLKKPRWSKFSELSTLASLIIILWV